MYVKHGMLIVDIGFQIYVYSSKKVPVSDSKIRCWNPMLTYLCWRHTYIKVVRT